MHSYWDDFWMLKGYEDAVSIATALGHADTAARIAAQRDEFRRDLSASLQASAAMHGIAYLPGSAELGDFDPTSTTIAFAPRGDVRDLPPAWVQSTYERYWREFTERRDGNSAWDAYTPYELRNVGTFVRLGWRDRAQELLAFFLEDMRPSAWHQWPEVIGRDPNKSALRRRHAARVDRVGFHRLGARPLRLRAQCRSGYRARCRHSTGVARRSPASASAICALPYGLLSYSLRKERRRTVLTLEAGSRPPGHFVFVWPWEEPPGATLVNGRTAHWQGNELHIDELPARVVVEGLDGRSARDSGKTHSPSRSADAHARPG